MKIFTRILLVFTLAAGMFAQQEKHTGDQPSKDAPPKKESVEDRGPMKENFYKLVFVIYELEDGKRSNQRDYLLIGKANYHPASIHIGTRVPVFVEEKKMQYLDAGLDIRCDLKDQQGTRLQVDCDVVVSNFIRPDQLAAGNASPAAPVMRSTRISDHALLTLGKPTVIATVDDVNSTRRMQVEVTATKVE